jgi:arylsulfatase
VHTVGFEFVLDPDTKAAAGGSGYLLVDGRRVAEHKFERTVTVSYASGETFDIGQEYGSPVVQTYADKMPNPFNGTIELVTVELQ